MTGPPNGHACTGSALTVAGHGSPDPARTVVAIVAHPDGWTIDAVIGGVVYQSPRPLSTRAAAEHLRTVLTGLLDLDDRPGPDPAGGGRLDPQRPSDCTGTAEALSTRTGIEIDPSVAADALRTLARDGRS